MTRARAWRTIGATEQRIGEHSLQRLRQLPWVARE